MAVMGALSIASMALSAVSTAATTAGGIISAQQNAAQAKQAAATADYNAQVQQRNALAEKNQQDAQDQQQMFANNQQLGQMRALYGASGIDPSAGTPLDVLQDQSQQMAYQTAQNDYAERIRQLGYGSEVQGLQQQASAYRQQAKNSTGVGMYLGAGASLAGGLAGALGSAGAKSSLSSALSGGGSQQERPFDFGGSRSLGGLA